uniref:Uncharacterized protein n=1 Tax=Thermodesulfovibrio aggregans TaxID=86166 RepID=A0A7C4EL83_9BACT
MLLSELKDKDLDFIVNTVAPEFKNKEQLKRFINEDPDFRHGLVGSDKMFEKVFSDPEILVKISPALYFEILLRKALNDLERLSYTYEKVGSYKIAVFDVSDVVEFLSDENVLLYLAHLLSSFTRIEKYTLWIKTGKNIWKRINFTDMDVEALKKMAQMIEEEYRFGIYKRIADACLFILGVFPEHLKESFETEEEGKKFYKLAGDYLSSETELANVFWQLSEKFNLAKKPLNFISENYLRWKKHQIFGLN